MPKITIDGIDYHTEDLSDNGKAQLASLQFLEIQINRIRNEITIFETARKSYASALVADMHKNGVAPIAQI